MQQEIKDDLTYKIIGWAMKVHSALGNGFQEVIYQRAFAIEMEAKDSVLLENKKGNYFRFFT